MLIITETRSLVYPMLEALIQWIIFSVVIALLPLLFNLLRDIGKGEGINLVRLFSHGELLLVSAAISAGSLGHLFGAENPSSIPKVVSGGSCVVVLMIASFWFADISGAWQSNPTLTLNSKAVCVGSIIIFTCAVFASSSCVLLGKV